MRTNNVYRLAVFATSTRTTGKGKRQRTKITGYGYMGWTADQSAERSRLAGSGTFCYAGGLRAIVAARAYLALPDTQQVQIRTNQDRHVLVYYKRPTGAITCYRSEEAA
jgi:hypothetical protein